MAKKPEKAKFYVVYNTSNDAIESVRYPSLEAAKGGLNYDYDDESDYEILECVRVARSERVGLAWKDE